METRDIILALLIVLVGAAIFYLLDPTCGGMMKHNKKYEGFENNNNNSEGNNSEVLSPAETNAPGMMEAHNYEANGPEHEYANAHGAHSIDTNAVPTPNTNNMNTEARNHEDVIEGFETLTPAPMPFKDAEKPANCYPKDQITPQELLPNDPNSKWAQVNPQGQGDIAGKNYLSAGALLGVNTVGQSLRNANYQLRSDPPNPQVKVSIWNQSTIEPDINRRALEIA
jgi:hypothetical protein